MSEPFIGEIRLVGFTFPPPGWAFCDGQLLAIGSNQPLFSLLGTNYGGDGETTFGLPDLRSRVPLHSGNGSAPPGLTPRPLGQKLGTENTNLTRGQMPSHNHVLGDPTLRATVTPANSNDPNGGALAMAPAYSNSAVPSADMHAGSVDNPPQTLNTGSGQAHSNMPPYLAVNFVIALQGIFPSES